MVDPITSEIVRNQLLAATDDMHVALTRSAFTPIIYEAGDCAVAILDRNGDVLAQSSGLPLFLGNLEQAVKDSLALRANQPDLVSGDAVCLNDSYIQGTHLLDLTVFTPIFSGAELVGYAVTRADISDIGGKDPGGGFATTEIYQEGLRLGPVLVEAAGRPVQDIQDIFRRNSRNGNLIVGDLNAMITSCRVGEQRVRAVIDRFGRGVLDEVRDHIFAQSERFDRATVAAVPDGIYSASGCMDDDGVAVGQPVKIQLKARVAGDRMTVDLAGSSGPVPGSINCGLAQTISSIKVAYRLVFGANRQPNGGSFRNLDVRVPERCFLNAREPAACVGYAMSAVLLMDLFIKAFSEVVPKQVCAGQFGDALTRLTGTDPNTGREFDVAEAHAGGWGGAPEADGADGVIDLTNGSFRNTPVEVLESRYPVRLLEYGYRRGSGGLGKHRGGCGIVRTYVFDADVEAYVWLDRTVTPAWGLFGGEPGSVARAWLRGPDREIEIKKANRLSISAGEELTILTGGGGGYGPKHDRAASDIARDDITGLADQRPHRIAVQSAS